MNTINFPKMFNGNSTIINTGNKASIECIHLLLSSEVGELFGDPDFGIRLKKYTFNQNNYILKDILIDEIYTQLATFCPQLILDRKNITIKQKENKLYAEIVAKNRIDFQTNVYSLVIFENEDGE